MIDSLLIAVRTNMGSMIKNLDELMQMELSWHYFVMLAE